MLSYSATEEGEGGSVGGMSLTGSGYINRLNRASAVQQDISTFHDSFGFERLGIAHQLVLEMCTARGTEVSDV